MNTIITGHLTCRHPQEAEEEVGGAAILTLLITTAMKIITITMDMITTTTGAATKTPTTAMTTTKGLCEEEEPEEAFVEVPVRPEAVVLSHQGADWASPNAEALDQSEVRGGWWGRNGFHYD